ncbi:hypothetical protein BIY22_05710 [Vibrio panuliri]|uniref:Uncharacterized protein n=1 Tax=Vibrio panuliri TaxID=1381081 RepID=A0A1Q9HJH0_9VIBR|nr:hypothetical protein [Vibrio panuliri]OLQ90488.1 hypothetical protein BIY22_05710 [Vibrio panuliri]
MKLTILVISHSNHLYRGLPVKTPTHMCIVLLLAHVLAKKRRVHLEISHTRYQLKKFIISTKLFS